MPLFNIFSKKKKFDKIATKPKIIADIHEKNSLVISNLASKCELEIKSLEVGDYIIGNFAIERKTSSDFISSMLSKRLQEQLKNLEQVKNKMIIIEGNFGIEKNSNLNPNSLRGQILAILNYHKIPIIFTKDSEETSEYLILLAKQQLKPLEELSLHSRKPSSIKEQKQYLIESFPGIGPKTAKELLKKFGSIKNIINASREELEEIIGKKAENLKELIEDSHL
jgi:Fanconi anemia group M protein